MLSFTIINTFYILFENFIICYRFHIVNNEVSNLFLWFALRYFVFLSPNIKNQVFVLYE
jgi:hypothetical protein